MTEPVKTQGTELFYIDPLAGSPAVVKLACPTGISGLGGAADQIDSTCLDDTVDKSFTRGLGNPGQVSVPFVLKPAEASHQELFDLKAAGNTINWMACLSESATDPTMDTDSEFVAAADRTCFAFDGYVADVNIDIATNEVVRGTLIIQRSGVVTATFPA